jgi:signal transduction histidine kinase
METLGNFLLLLIKQFAGGPGPMENNLMRFGLAAIFWLVLLIIAWTRQSKQDLPRERLLVWGFGAALLRELIMFGMTTGKLTGLIDPGWDDIYFFPLENGLSMAAVVVVTGAFLQYALKEELISRGYLQIGLLLTFLTTAVAYVTWPKIARSSQGVHFSDTWESRAFHLLSILLLAVGIYLLMRKNVWIRRVASVALGFLLISEVLFLVSNWMEMNLNHILCPISNAFHILAIPIFGFVYLNEMSIEKKETEDRLDEYRNHLEELVDERTSMLVAQHEIVDSLSQSLDLETVLNMALDKVLSVLSMEVGLLFLLDREGGSIHLGAYRGRLSHKDIEMCILEGCLYEKLSMEAIEKQVIIQTEYDDSMSSFFHVKREELELLISVPLLSKDQVIGALIIGSKNETPLDQTNLELLNAVGHQIGMAVENAYLYQEAEVWAEELSRLHRASVNLGSTLDATEINKEIAIQSTLITGRPMACVVYRDESSEELEIISSVGINQEIEDLILKDGAACDLIDDLLESKSSIILNDIQSDSRILDSWKAGLGVKSLVSTPIWDVDEPVEFLFIFDPDESRTWRSKHVELVESFISRAAVALENAQLYKQLEWAATLEERQRIAAEMHDGLAQTISLVGLKVDQISELIPEGSDINLDLALKETRDSVGHALVEARKSIASLHATPQPRRSLQGILTSLVDKWSEEWPDGNGSELTTSFQFSDPLFLPPNQVSQIIPIVQEAIINARKHSGATEIKIKGQQNDKQTMITVEDNGKGFDVNKSFDEDDHHFGLKIMRARAARFGGKFEIVSDQDCGTIITLSWDLGRERSGARDSIDQTPAQIVSIATEGEQDG